MKTLNAPRSARRLALAGLACICLSLYADFATAQTYIMMPDSNAANNRIVLFDPNDGSLVNSSYFGIAGGTPIHAMQVGNEIWVSEQIGDRISRWGLTGTSLGAIGGGPTGGLDNIRGMGLLNNTVYLTNDGTGNTAPGDSVIMFDTSGASLGFFSTSGTNSSPFGILEYPGGMLVSSSAANDDIHKYDLAGTPLGTFHNTASISFAEQMDYAANGDVLVAVFTSNIVARLDATSGAFLSSFAASSARGVYQLPNGNIMWTNSAGAHVHNVATGGSTQVYTGGGRYLDILVIPTTGCACPGDLVADLTINGLDIPLFTGCFVSGGANCDCADIDGVGGITADDLPLFVARLLEGTTCP